MRRTIYNVLFWPGFIVGWVAQCVMLGYEAGKDSFLGWALDSSGIELNELDLSEPGPHIEPSTPWPRR